MGDERSLLSTGTNCVLYRVLSKVRNALDTCQKSVGSASIWNTWVPSTNPKGIARDHVAGIPESVVQLFAEYDIIAPLIHMYHEEAKVLVQVSVVAHATASAASVENLWVW